MGTNYTAQNSTTVSALNTELDKIETALEDTFSRSGVAPNAMEANLDMNGNAILNLPVPSTPNSPVRLQDISNTLALECGRLVGSATSIYNLFSMPKKDGAGYQLLGYYEPNGVGAGELVYSSSENKQNHNGVDVFDPDHTLSIGEQSDWYLPQNTGTGCFKRVGIGSEVTASMAGFLPETNRHSIIRNIWTASNLSKWTKFTFDVKGEYQFNKSVGDSRVHTMENVSDFIVEVGSGVTLHIDADITTSFNDGFRFKNSSNVHWTGKGTIKCLNTGSPTVRRESMLILFSDGSINCSVHSGLKLGQFLAADMPFGALYGVRFSGNTLFPKVYKITFLEGTQGRSVQFGSSLSYEAYGNVWLGLGSDKIERNRSYGIRMLGAEIATLAGRVHSNFIKISSDAKAVTGIGVEGGANQLLSNPSRDFSIDNNQIYMFERDADADIKSIYGIAFLDCRDGSIKSNKIWMANHSGSDQFYGIRATKSAIVPDNFTQNINIYDNEIQSRWAFYFQENVSEGVRDIRFGRNKVGKAFSNTGLVLNQCVRKFNLNGTGVVSESNGISDSPDTVEVITDGDTTWYKYASGKLECYHTKRILLDSAWTSESPTFMIGGESVSIFPFEGSDLFVGKSTRLASAGVGDNSGNRFCTIRYRSGSVGSPAHYQVIPLDPASQSATAWYLDLCHHIIGRWKEL